MNRLGSISVAPACAAALSIPLRPGCATISTVWPRAACTASVTACRVAARLRRRTTARWLPDRIRLDPAHGVGGVAPRGCLARPIADCVRPRGSGRSRESPSEVRNPSPSSTTSVRFVVAGDRRPLPPQKSGGNRNDRNDLGRRGEQLSDPTSCRTHQVARVAGEYGRQPWENGLRRDGRCAQAWLVAVASIALLDAACRHRRQPTFVRRVGRRARPGSTSPCR